LEFLIIHPNKSLSELGSRWHSVLAALGNLQSLQKAEAIDDLAAKWDEKCEHFFQVYQNCFPLRKRTPKQHILKGWSTCNVVCKNVAVHVPQFIRNHGDLGVYTEQPIESFHVQYNRISRNLVGKGGQDRIMRQMICNAVFHWDQIRGNVRPNLDETHPFVNDENDDPMTSSGSDEEMVGICSVSNRFL
jgi:hypothetical protein